MYELDYIPPNRRALHQPAVKWLLITQFFTIVPFMSYLPQWLLLVFGLAVIWRFRVMRGQLRKPPLLLMIAAVIIGIGSLLVSGFSQYTLDAAVSLCVLGYLLKSFEVLRRRDGVFLVYLGFFLAGVFLLYRFDPLGALIMLLLLVLNALTLQAITAERHFKGSYAVKQTAWLVLAAIPVMVMGYLFFPRIPPLWTIPNDERGARTGMTDEITPGSVADLARSSEPAFRVSFEGDIPPRDVWYWRGNTLSRFEDGSWSAIFRENRIRFSFQNNELPKPVESSQRFDYNVVMESSGRRWLYFLDWPTEVDADRSAILPDGRAARFAPINSNFRYYATSYAEVSWPDQTRMLEFNLELPSSGNEALRTWAIEQRQRVGSDQAFVSWLAQYITNEPYFYTVQPPLYPGEQSLADFWLFGRQGFCSHYASAIAFILRSVDIPARLVGGYLGGNYNANGNYIQVRQMEAHVWNEIWLDDRWVRFDPTAYVAPGRVLSNIDDLVEEGVAAELPLISRVSRLSMISALTMYWDSALYQWQVLVLDYDNSRAISVFESVLGRFTPLKAVILLLTVLSMVALVIAVATGMIRLPKYVSEPYRSLRQIEKKFGARQSHETLSQYFARLRQAHPDIESLSAIQAEFEAYLYGKDSQIGDRFWALKRELQRARV